MSISVEAFCKLDLIHNVRICTDIKGWQSWKALLSNRDCGSTMEDFIALHHHIWKQRTIEGKGVLL